LLGSYTDVGGAALLNATAIGYRAYVTQSNSIVLGSINGTNGATVDTKVGIGTTAPTEKLDVNGNINLTGVLKLVGSSGTVGQVLTSNGSGSPAWRNASYGNNTRFSIRFSGNPSQNGQATIAEIFYNLNPTDVVLASPLITINRSGLYHFDFAFAANITYAVTPTIYPRFSLNLSVNSSFYYLTVNEVMIPSSNTNTNWWVNRNGSIDLHIIAPTTLYLEHFYLPAGGTSHGLSGFFNGYLISE